MVRFVRDCKQRPERHKALRAKRGKVRELLAQAIVTLRQLYQSGIRFQIVGRRGLP
jgi:hypothetical protein